MCDKIDGFNWHNLSYFLKNILACELKEQGNFLVQKASLDLQWDYQHGTSHTNLV